MVKNSPRGFLTQDAWVGVLKLAFLKIYFIEVQLIYNVLISVVQQSDSVIYKCIYYNIIYNAYIYIYAHTHLLSFSSECAFSKKYSGDANTVEPETTLSELMS